MSLTAKDITPAIMLAFGRRASVKHIQEEVAAFYGIPSEYMRIPDRVGSREMRIARPRQVAMFFAQKLTGLPLTEIGRRFGGRDHSTVIHAKKAVEQRAAADPYVEMELEVLRERLAA
jgi:chromosomal replication initiator protein